MSWLYSRALVEEFSEATCSDGARSALSSGSPTPQAFLPPDKTTAFSRLSRFGMTFGPLTEDLGADVLTWCLGDFLAKTSAWQERALALKASGLVFGERCGELLAKFDPSSSTWKTAQPSLLGDSEECSVTWPRSGMTAGGLCLELPTLGRRISATGSGLWLPTPTAHNAREAAYPSEYTRNCPTLATHAGGRLNPMWVEWMMGWPLGWTDLKPSATVKSPPALPQPGEFSQAEVAA